MEAMQAALTHRVTVLTGGPGTGKTTTVRSIIRLAEAAGARTVLASPTGRAAKRLSEATGQPAKTIHRLLEFKPAEGFSFQRNEENPLEADLVIVDEASMLDLLLTNNLLKAIPPGAHLLLVGDVDQLPSVGAGNVLHDVIEAIEGGQGQGRELGDVMPDSAPTPPRPSSAWTPSSASPRAATSSPTPTASTRGRCRSWTTATPPTSSCFGRRTRPRRPIWSWSWCRSGSRASSASSPRRSRCSAPCTAARSAWRRSTSGCRRR